MISSLLTENQVSEVWSLISGSHRIVILTHMSPDGDAMGSSLAMRHYLMSLGKEVNVVIPNSFPDFLDWLPMADKDYIYETQAKEADVILEAAELIIITDFNEPKRIGSLGDKMLQVHAKRIMIDHHLNPHAFADVMLSYPEASSTCELVFRLLYQLKERYAEAEQKSLRLQTAECIYTGLMTDTGNFSYNSNRCDLYEIISMLVREGIDKDSIYNRVFMAYSEDRMRLMGYCLYQKMRIFLEHHTALIYLSRKELYRFNFQSGDAEGIVNLPLQIKGIHYSVFMREDSVNSTEVGLANGSTTKVKISLRSQGSRPVNVFAHEIFGGGGHANASGGEFYGGLPDAVTRFMEHYEDYFRKD